MNKILKIFTIICFILITGIVALYLIFCHNPEKILSESPYDSHYITVRSEECITFTLPGHGQKSSLSKFKNFNKILYTYKVEEPSHEGDRIDNVLWYRDSACIYIQGTYYNIKEIIYYDTNSKKRKRISGNNANKEIIEYYSKKLKGKWISSIDTMNIDNSFVTIKRNGKKEIHKLEFPEKSSSYLLRYNEIIFCRSLHSYRELIYIDDNKLKLLLYDDKTKEKNVLQYIKNEKSN